MLMVVAGLPKHSPRRGGGRKGRWGKSADWHGGMVPPRPYRKSLVLTKSAIVGYTGKFGGYARGTGMAYCRPAFYGIQTDRLS